MNINNTHLPQYVLQHWSKPHNTTQLAMLHRYSKSNMNSMLISITKINTSKTPGLNFCVCARRAFRLQDSSMTLEKKTRYKDISNTKTGTCEGYILRWGCMNTTEMQTFNYLLSYDYINKGMYYDCQWDHYTPKCKCSYSNVCSPCLSIQQQWVIFSQNIITVVC